MGILISVIVPVYNTGEYLIECIQSILSQDYKDLEIIIVDDGSTDHITVNNCDMLAQNNRNVKVFHKQNGGSADARNFGVKYAKGEYIGFVDSDDYIEKGMYSALIKDVLKYKVKMAICNLVIDDYKKISRPDMLTRNGKFSTRTIMHYFLLGNWHSACTALYHKSVFENNRFPVNETNEDYIFNYHVLRSLKCVSINTYSFYHYVKRQGSNTTATASIKNLDWVSHTSYIYKDIIAKMSEMKKEAEYQLLFSLIVLSNKALLGMAHHQSNDANELYNATTINLKHHKKILLTNKYMTVKYRLMGMCMAFCPKLYKKIVLLCL